MSPLFFAAFAGSVAAAPPPLTLSLTPNGASVGTVDIVVDPSSTQGSKVLFLRQDGSTPVLGVRLKASLDGAAVTTAVDGADTAGTFTIPPAPGVAVVTVSVTGVSADVELTGSLVALDANGEAAGLPPLKVTRAPAPAVVVLGTDANGAITRTSPTAEYSDLLQLSATTTAAAEVTVSPGSLVNEVGTKAVLAVGAGNQLSVGNVVVSIATGYGVTPLLIQANLPEPGSYTGVLVLTYGQTRQSVPVTIKRTRVAPQIQVQSILAIEDSVWPLWSTNIQLPVSVRETGGRSTPLTASIQGFGRKSGTAVVSATENGEYPADSTKPITLEAGQAAQFTLALPTIHGPGEYNGTARLLGADGTATDTTFSIYVRYSWWIAAAVIFIGVAVSEMLRWYFRIHRPRLVLSIQASGIIEQLTTVGATVPPDGPERATIDALRQRVQTIADGLGAGDQAGQLNEVQAKLTVLVRWLSAWSRARATGNTKALAVKLADVGDKLRRSGSWSADEAGVTQTLDAVDAELTAAPMHDDLASIRTAVDKWKQAHPGDTGADGITAGLKAMDDALSAGDAAQAAILLPAQQAALVPLLATDLRDLAGRQSAPTGVDPAAWTAAKAMLIAAATTMDGAPVDEALAAYDDAQKSVVRVLIAGLGKRVDIKIKSLQNTANADDLRLQLVAILTQLNAAAGMVDSDASGASRTYSELAKAYTDLAPDFAPFGIAMGPADTPSAAPIALSATSDVTDASPTPILQIAASGKLRKQFRSEEFAVSFVLLLIAVASGVMLLWVDDFTWGSPKDIVVAILWGLGLHQAGTTTFQGLGGLRNTYTKAAEAT